MKTIQGAALQKLADARSLVNSVHQIDGAGHFIRSSMERELVTNAYFLNVFIALEEFFEASFAHYMTGKMSTVRWRPSNYARPPSADHAHRLLVGTQRFVDWSTPDTVKKLADLYFKDGEPYRTALGSVHGHLNRMKTVRNSTAHVSKSTQVALDAVYSAWTGTPTINATAYAALMSVESGGTDSFYGASERVVKSILSQVASHA